MQKKILLFFFFLGLINSYQAQVQLSVYSEISIVTAGPGTELYEAFGHSAIRIKDPVLNLDLIYNYGMFDFNAPNFYSNFTKGKLIYSLARYKFEYFLASYQRDKRWVKQQVLNLDQQQRQAFFMYLENNAMPNNATYFYDPYFNNCATKLRDITAILLEDNVQFSDVGVEKDQSFRKLMNKEIPWNTWGNFGINLALGNTLDQKQAYTNYMYLPDYVYLIFKNSTININGKKENLVKREDVLLDFKELKQTIVIFNPFLIFGIIAILGLWITYKDYQQKKRTKLLDFSLLFITGIVGVLIVFLWFFTDHSTTPNNFNFLWAFAPNLFIAFLMLKKQPKKWIAHYFKLLLLFLIGIPILWIAGIQLFPVAAIPLLILLVLRYLFLSKAIK